MKRVKTIETWLTKTNFQPSWCRKISLPGTPKTAVEPSFLSRIRRRLKETINHCAPSKKASTFLMRRFLLWSLRWSSRVKLLNYKYFTCNPRQTCRNKSKLCRSRTHTPPPCPTTTKNKLFRWQLNWAEISISSNSTIRTLVLVVREATCSTGEENGKLWALEPRSRTSTMKIAALLVAMSRRTHECKYSTKFSIPISNLRLFFAFHSKKRRIRVLLVVSFKLHNI